VSLDLDACTDGELAALSLGGRQAAFAVIMARHREPLYRLIRASIGDSGDALDLVQETFVAAHMALKKYDQARGLRAWLARIAINKCRDWARRRTVRKVFFRAAPLDDAAYAIAGDEPDALETVSQRQELRRVERVIAELPFALKEPLLLRTIDGMSQAETAATLGISEKAVETRVRRARAQLSAQLGRD
jgi:RNA polymerase sigma factor (sigma-70 family)